MIAHFQIPTHPLSIGLEALGLEPSTLLGEGAGEEVPQTK